jgi:hypothetical protein
VFRADVSSIIDSWPLRPCRRRRRRRPPVLV